MLIFDQLKKDDPHLRLLAAIVAGGILILLIGLWWVQLVSTKHFQEKLEVQSTRSVRIPAIRGRILDRNGRPLADNHPVYSINLYLDELSRTYANASETVISQTKNNFKLQLAARKKQLGRNLTPAEKTGLVMTKQLREQIDQQIRYQVTSNLLAGLSVKLQQPISLTQTNFEKWYDKSRVLPLPVLANLNPVQIGRFEEQSANVPGLDLEVQSVRFYPHNMTAAHLLGYLTRDNESKDDRDYNYRLADYVGVSGIEGLFDDDLHGSAGAKTVVINNNGFRQSETIDSPPLPGQNVVLTLDLDIQKAADAALLSAQLNVRGAVVVMDAQNGDILAMVSAPSYDPNYRIHPDPATQQTESERWNDEDLGLQKNRATFENYHPGSIFKIVVAMAALEQGVLDPKEAFHSEGYFLVGRSPVRHGDTAGAGLFDFNRAFAKSSNPYFVHYGTNAGVLSKILALGQRLHLGEKTGIMPRQETGGYFPNQKLIANNWYLGDTANLSIGQGKIDVTPVQMAIMTAAVANGGKVFWPRLVARIESSDETGAPQIFPAARLRDNLGVSPRTLSVVHGGMLFDVESDEGSGRGVAIPGWGRIAGKTGTAEVEKHGAKDSSAKNTWFVSFAPVDKPKYVVVATVEGGLSGGKTCVPVVHKIYLALQQMERKAATKPVALTQTH